MAVLEIGHSFFQRLGTLGRPRKVTSGDRKTHFADLMTIPYL
jgi:hypothetical protein